MTLRVLSLGGGVQSSTLLLMSLSGELDRLDAAIFADTGWEPKAVYQHIAWLREQCDVAGVPLHTVSGGDLRTHALEMVRTGKEFPGMPLHAFDERGNHSLLKRQCTGTYKVRPIHRQIRAIAGQVGKPWRGEPAEQWLGISMDEAQRMRDSRDTWITLRYPLIERRMRRADCLTWLQAHGYPIPPKSACIGCPFHGDAQWRHLRDTSPLEFADAIAFDAAIRAVPRLRGSAYLHQSGVPLNAVDLSTPSERGQTSMFDRECEGVCEV